MDESSEMSLGFEAGLNWLLFWETDVQCHSVSENLQTVILRRYLSFVVGFIKKMYAFLMYSLIVQAPKFRILVCDLLLP